MVAFRSARQPLAPALGRDRRAQVPRRVAALLTAPPRRGAWAPATATAIVLLAVVAAALAAADLHALVEFGQAADRALRG